MAKTPLFSFLMRQLAAEREARRLGRREFLAGASVVAAGVGGCGDDDDDNGGTAGAAGSGQAGSSGQAGAGQAGSSGQAGGGGAGGEGPGAKARVVIVGGGVAGLHCAVRLGELGIKATVYEGSKRVGGRIFSDRATFGDQSCELGGELIDTGHQTMQDLCKQYGLDLLDYTQDDATLRTYWPSIGGKVLTDAEVLDAFKPVAAKIDAALATLTDQEDLWVYFDKPNGGENLDKLSLAQWFDQQGITGPIRTLLEVAYLIEYGLEVDETNALNFLFLVSSETEKFEAFGASDERFRVTKGNDALITALAGDLAAGQVVFEHKLTALRQQADGVIKLTFDKAGTPVEVEADRVVLALPFTMLRDVTLEATLSAPKLKAIKELGYGTNAKLMIGFASKPWRTQGSNGEVFTDLPLQSTWETSRLQPGATGILTNFVGGDRGIAMGQGTPEERRDEALGDLDKIFAGTKAASNGKVARMHWPTAPFVKASYAAYRVGQYGQMSGAEGLAEGTLHFCGEHTSLEAQGYMEGGAESGARAALEVAEALGFEPMAMMRVAPIMARPRSRLGTPVQRILARAQMMRRHRRYAVALKRGFR